MVRAGEASSSAVCVGRPQIRKPRKSKKQATDAEETRTPQEYSMHRNSINIKSAKWDNLCNAVCETTGLSKERIGCTLEAFHEIITERLREDGVIEIPDIIILRLKERKARPASTKTIMGRVVDLPAKPAGTRVCASVRKPLKMMFNE